MQTTGGTKVCDENVIKWLGEMSPMNAKSGASSASSLSLRGGGKATSGVPASSASAMSTDSTRPPLGEMQNNFEFQPGPAAGEVVKPFSSRLASKAASQMTAAEVTTEPATPTSVVAESAPSEDKGLAIMDVLLWKAPLHSLCMFVLGLTLFAALTFLAYGAYQLTVASAVCYLLLADLSLNFIRYFTSKSWHENSLWSNSAWAQHLTQRATLAICRVAALHDAYLSTKDPVVTLKVAIGLWAMAWLSASMSLWYLVLLCYIGAFTVPLAAVAFQDQLSQVACQIKVLTVDKLDAAGLPRTGRLAAAALFLGFLFLLSTWTQFGIGVIVALTYWRTLLVPQEVEAIREAAAPYTQSVQKVKAHMSVVAKQAYERYQASTAGPSSRTKSRFSAKHD